MIKRIRRMLYLGLTLAVLLSFTSFSPANAQTYYSKYIDFPIDIDGSVRYIGEKIPVYYIMDDIWTYYYTDSYVQLVRDSDIEIIETRRVGRVPANDSAEELLSFKTKSLKPGKYSVIVTGVPVYSDGSLVDDIDAIDWERADFEITLRKLLAPKALKVVAGKKRVAITYKKASGANKYQIYRSLKKNSGFKRIATTTRLKYVDKKVKKGKRYYYKVRSVRTETVDTVTSSFTKPIRSKKVR